MAVWGVEVERRLMAVSGKWGGENRRMMLHFTSKKWWLTHEPPFLIASAPFSKASASFSRASAPFSQVSAPFFRWELPFLDYNMAVFCCGRTLENKDNLPVYL